MSMNQHYQLLKKRKNFAAPKSKKIANLEEQMNGIKDVIESGTVQEPLVSVAIAM